MSTATTNNQSVSQNEILLPISVNWCHKELTGLILMLEKLIDSFDHTHYGYLGGISSGDHGVEKDVQVIFNCDQKVDREQATLAHILRHLCMWSPNPKCLGLIQLRDSTFGASCFHNVSQKYIQCAITVHAHTKNQAKELLQSFRDGLPIQLQQLFKTIVNKKDAKNPTWEAKCDSPDAATIAHIVDHWNRTNKIKNDWLDTSQPLTGGIIIVRKQTINTNN